MLEVENTRLLITDMSLAETDKSTAEEIKCLKRHIVLLEQPKRGSAAYAKNEQTRQTALLFKERADAAKYKAQPENLKRKLKRTKRKLGRVYWTKSKVSKTIWKRK
jgi:hypothetical protein